MLDRRLEISPRPSVVLISEYESSLTILWLGLLKHSNVFAGGFRGSSPEHVEYSNDLVLLRNFLRSFSVNSPVSIIFSRVFKKIEKE